MQVLSDESKLDLAMDHSSDTVHFSDSQDKFEMKNNFSVSIFLGHIKAIPNSNKEC